MNQTQALNLHWPWTVVFLRCSRRKNSKCLSSFATMVANMVWWQASSAKPIQQIWPRPKRKRTKTKCSRLGIICEGISIYVWVHKCFSTNVSSDFPEFCEDIIPQQLETKKYQLDTRPIICKTL
ncbi:hypothetical protein [Pseudomonas fluorescens]|uniref:hypothetical protein n=1 Tax=Pseudomonas fluorescens TaxID=294 RepID=UPI003CFE885F